MKLISGALFAFAALSSTSLARAGELQGYGFEAAAQEITQLFWLAETASACGWASDEDAVRFKHFSVRFLAAHLSNTNQAALRSLVSENGYEEKVRRVVRESAGVNCDSNRWRNGWVAYKAAADQRADEF
ncbi:MAG: hypothetical protein C5B46_05810 [Proteobacteria bacterium]|nr:MAG: hypothetical protein C5B46_05810 [Pseudomonadota bacterium]